jgi:hypothetical protein
MIPRRNSWPLLCRGILAASVIGCDSTVEAPAVEEVKLGGVYCKVNGENWSNPPYFPYQVVSVGRTDDSGFAIGADNWFDPLGDSFLSFDIDSLVVGPQVVGHVRFARDITYECDGCGAVNLIQIDTLHNSGNLRGTFEFRLRSESGDSVRVTDGRFFVPVYFKL